MSHPPVIFFAGERRIAIPYVIYFSTLLVLAVACAAAVANSVLPRLLGTGPILPIPEALQAIANVLAYVTAFAAMIVLMLFLLSLWEARLSARRFTDFRRLIPLPELLSSQLTIAPNVAEADRDLIITALKRLARHDGISSIIAAATAGDIEDGSIDRLFVTTTHSAADFRRIIRSLRCDDVSKVPARPAREIVTKAQFGKGSVWLLTWD